MMTCSTVPLPVRGIMPVRPATMSDNGMPPPSISKWRLLPLLPRSVGLGATPDCMTGRHELRDYRLSWRLPGLPPPLSRPSTASASPHPDPLPWPTASLARARPYRSPRGARARLASAVTRTVCRNSWKRRDGSCGSCGACPGTPPTRSSAKGITDNDSSRKWGLAKGATPCKVTSR